MTAKTVDDILVIAEKDVVDRLLESTVAKFKFGEVVHGPGTLHYFEFNITEREDLTCTVDRDNKLWALQSPHFSRTCDGRL